MVSLSQKIVDALPADRDSVTWDDDTPGLGLRVQGGKRSWVVRYRVAGVQRQKTLPGGLKLGNARDQANAIRTAATIDGVDRVAVRRAAAASRRKAEQADRDQRHRQLGKIIDGYLAGPATKLAPRTLVEVRRYLNEAWRPLHDRDADNLDRRAIVAELERITRERGPIASNRARAYLSSCLSYGVERGLLDRNVVIGIKRLEPEITRDRVLSDEELRAVWLAAGDDDYGRIVKVLILTGQRRDEVGGMDLAEVDHAKAMWTLPAARTKNDKAHDVPLAPAVLALIGAPRADRSHAFGRGKAGFSGWSASKMRLDARIACQRAEMRLGRPLLTGEKLEPGGALRPWTLHDLRRTAITGMAEIGVPPHIIEAIVNHVSGHKGGVAGVYNRAKYSQEKRAALQRWADHIERIVKGETAANVVSMIS